MSNIDSSNSLQSGDPSNQILLSALNAGSLDGAIEQTSASDQSQVTMFAISSANKEASSITEQLLSSLTGLGGKVDTGA